MVLVTPMDLNVRILALYEKPLVLKRRRRVLLLEAWEWLEKPVIFSFSQETFKPCSMSSCTHSAFPFSPEIARWLQHRGCQQQYCHLARRTALAEIFLSHLIVPGSPLAKGSPQYFKNNDKTWFSRFMKLNYFIVWLEESRFRSISFKIVLEQVLARN